MNVKLRTLYGLSILIASAEAFLNGTEGDNTFDYVVVGGGTAGIPVGTRLAEAGYKVAIVEAGSFYEDSEPLISETPAFDFVGNALNDWGFDVAPQVGMNGRSFPYPRGKCVGGTSARNAMIYQRGPSGSFQKWADEVGDQSYAFPEFEKYFKKGVSFTPPDLSKRASNSTPSYNAGAFSPAGGPLTVTYANWAAPFSSWVKRAMSAIGIKDAGDLNSGSILGSQWFPVTVVPQSQRRASSQNTYLTVFDPPNLTVYINTMGEKIVFDDQKKAIAVEVQTQGNLYTLRVNKEVIVSAGAFQSPQLLMVSGVGPASTLSEHSIPLIYDNPNVGQNLVDHTWFGPTYRVKVETITKWTNDAFYMLNQYAGPYQQQQNGPLTTNAGDFGAFEKVPEDLRSNFTAETLEDLARFPTDWPEVEYVSAPAYLGNFSNPLASQPKDGYMYASIVAALVAPLSRGNVTISSADTNDPPVINPNILTSPTDQQVGVAAYKRIRQMFRSSEMAPVLIGDEYFPGSSVQSDEELLENIKENGAVYYHAGSSCAMGNPNATDSKAVVDSKARVIGVNGVRVVDASALPFLPPSHIQSSIYALAEKIADEMVGGAVKGRLHVQSELKRRNI